jgi:hypothetical protein
MPEDGFRETDRFAREPFETSTKCERFALNLLGVDFPDSLRGGREMPVVDSRRIRIKMHQAKGLEQLR